MRQVIEPQWCLLQNIKPAGAARSLNTAHVLCGNKDSKEKEKSSSVSLLPLNSEENKRVSFVEEKQGQL